MTKTHRCKYTWLKANEPWCSDTGRLHRCKHATTHKVPYTGLRLHLKGLSLLSKVHKCSCGAEKRRD